MSNNDADVGIKKTFPHDVAASVRKEKLLCSLTTTTTLSSESASSPSLTTNRNVTASFTPWSSGRTRRASSSSGSRLSLSRRRAERQERQDLDDLEFSQTKSTLELQALSSPPSPSPGGQKQNHCESSRKGNSDSNLVGGKERLIIEEERSSSSDDENDSEMENNSHDQHSMESQQDLGLLLTQAPPPPPPINDENDSNNSSSSDEYDDDTNDVTIGLHENFSQEAENDTTGTLSSFKNDNPSRTGNPLRTSNVIVNKGNVRAALQGTGTCTRIEKTRQDVPVVQSEHSYNRQHIIITSSSPPSTPIQSATGTCLTIPVHPSTPATIGGSTSTPNTCSDENKEVDATTPSRSYTYHTSSNGQMMNSNDTSKQSTRFSDTTSPYDIMKNREIRMRRNEDMMKSLGFSQPRKTTQKLLDHDYISSSEDENDATTIPQRRGMLFETKYNNLSTEKYNVAGDSSGASNKGMNIKKPPSPSIPVVGLEVDNVKHVRKFTSIEDLKVRYPNRSNQVDMLSCLFETSVRQAEYARSQYIQRDGNDGLLEEDNAIDPYVPPPIFVTGPSGTGKSSIVRDILNVIQQNAKAKISSDDTNVGVGVAYTNCSTFEPCKFRFTRIYISNR